MFLAIIMLLGILPLNDSINILNSIESIVNAEPVDGEMDAEPPADDSTNNGGPSGNSNYDPSQPLTTEQLLTDKVEGMETIVQIVDNVSDEEIEKADIPKSTNGKYLKMTNSNGAVTYMPIEVELKTNKTEKNGPTVKMWLYEIYAASVVENGVWTWHEDNDEVDAESVYYEVGQFFYWPESYASGNSCPENLNELRNLSHLAGSDGITEKYLNSVTKMGSAGGSWMNPSEWPGQGSNSEHTYPSGSGYTSDKYITTISQWFQPVQWASTAYRYGTTNNLVTDRPNAALSDESFGTSDILKQTNDINKNGIKDIVDVLWGMDTNGLPVQAGDPPKLSTTAFWPTTVLLQFKGEYFVPRYFWAIEPRSDDYVLAEISTAAFRNDKGPSSEQKYPASVFEEGATLRANPTKANSTNIKNAGKVNLWFVNANTYKNGRDNQRIVNNYNNSTGILDCDNSCELGRVSYKKTEDAAEPTTFIIYKGDDTKLSWTWRKFLFVMVDENDSSYQKYFLDFTGKYVDDYFSKGMGWADDNGKFAGKEPSDDERQKLIEAYQTIVGLDRYVGTAPIRETIFGKTGVNGEDVHMTIEYTELEYTKRIADQKVVTYKGIAKEWQDSETGLAAIYNPYYPGVYNQVVASIGGMPDEYNWCSYTGKLRWCLDYLTLNDICGDGMHYGKFMYARRYPDMNFNYYNGRNLGRTYVEVPVNISAIDPQKDLLVNTPVGVEDEELAYYATLLWAPKFEYDDNGELTGFAKEWKDMTEEARMEALRTTYAEKEPFLEAFDPVPPFETDEVTGESIGALKYEYPYVLRSASEVVTTNEDFKTAWDDNTGTAFGLAAQTARNDIYMQFVSKTFVTTDFGEVYSNFWYTAENSATVNEEAMVKQMEIWDKNITKVRNKIDGEYVVFGPSAKGTWVQDDSTPFSTNIYGRSANSLNHMNETWEGQGILAFDNVIRGLSVSLTGSTIAADSVLWQDRIFANNITTGWSEDYDYKMRLDAEENSINEQMTNVNVYNSIYTTPSEEELRKQLHVAEDDFTPIYVAFRASLFDPVQLLTEQYDNKRYSTEIFDPESETGKWYLSKNNDVVSNTQTMFAEALLGIHEALGMEYEEILELQDTIAEMEEPKDQIEYIANLVVQNKSDISLDSSIMDDKETLIKSGLIPVYISNMNTIASMTKDGGQPDIEQLKSMTATITQYYLNDNTNTANDFAVVVYQYVPPANPPRKNLRFTGVTVSNGTYTESTAEDYAPSGDTHKMQIFVDGTDQKLLGDYTISVDEIYELMNSEEEIETFSDEERLSFADTWDVDVEITSDIPEVIPNPTIDKKTTEPTPTRKLDNEENSKYELGTTTKVPVKAVWDWMNDPDKNKDRRDTATITVSISIPDRYSDDPEKVDNCTRKDWEKIVITFVIRPNVANEDNEISSCELFDNTGKSYGKYVREGDTWKPVDIKYLDMNPDLTYYAEITVKRNVTDPQNQVLQLNSGSTDVWTSPTSINVGTASFDKYLNAIWDAGSEKNVEAWLKLKSGSSTQLSKNGDTAVYELNPERTLTIKYQDGTETTKYTKGLMSVGSQSIEINAFFTPEDSNRKNNFGDGGWNNKPWIWTGPGVDYVASNLEINPSPAVYLDCNEAFTRDVDLRFSAKFSLMAEGVESEYLPMDDVNISIWMFEKKPTDVTYSSSGGVKVYSDQLSLKRNGATQVVSGQLGIGASKGSPGSPITLKAGCSYRFIAIINGGNDVPGRVPSERTYPAGSGGSDHSGEINWFNNETFMEISVDNSELCEMSCNKDGKDLCQQTSNIQQENLKNDWNTTFHFEEEPTEVWYWCCTSWDSEGGCTGGCVCCCYSTDYHHWDVTVHFYETLEVTFYYRSQEDPNWKAVSPGSSEEIRAGHWYEIRIKSVYSTNRYPDTPKPDPYSHCNWLTRSPGYDDSNGRRTTIIEMENATGGQYRSWKWTESGKIQDKTIQRFSIPENTQNLNIVYKFGIAGFTGANADSSLPKSEHPSSTRTRDKAGSGADLCYNCRTFTVKVKNPNPIIGGNTEIV